MADADVTVDPVKAAAMYDQAQKTIIGDVSSMMFWNNVNSYLVKPWVKGAVTTPQAGDDSDQHGRPGDCPLRHGR